MKQAPPPLQRVLAAVGRAVVEAIWCLGDIVSLDATVAVDFRDHGEAHRKRGCATRRASLATL